MTSRPAGRLDRHLPRAPRARWLLAASLLVAGPAAAQDAADLPVRSGPQEPPADEQPPRLAWDVLGEVGFFTTHDPGAPDLVDVTVVARADWLPLPELALRAVWPWIVAMNAIPPSGLGSWQTSVAPDSGNPFLGAAWARDDENARIRVGGGLTIPFAQGGAGPDVGQAMYGAAEPWLWLRDTMAFVASGEAQTARPIAGVLHGGATFAVAALVPVSNTGPASFVLQPTCFVGVRTMIPEATFGARFAVAWNPLRDIDYGPGADPASPDHVQMSLAPYVRVETARWIVDLTLLMNLDPPRGFAFDPRGVWALRLSVGGRF